MRINKIWIAIIVILAAILILSFYPPPQSVQVKYIDRESGVIKTEKVTGEEWLVWLYNNPVGEATLWTLVKRKMISSIYGELMKRPSSTSKIEDFVDEFDINLDETQKQGFNSFNEFFTRKLNEGARPIDGDSTVVVSPADGKIMAWENISNTDFIIKGYRFNVASFLDDTELAEKYDDGSFIVIRLAPNNYHRFHFPVSGSVSDLTKIEGDYYSVNPIALREMVEIFCLNKREYVIISSATFGAVVMAEIGATMVGNIVQTYSGNEVIKGDEKGYFEFGGSTVVLLFEKDKIEIDQDLQENTRKGLETTVKVGERIGRSY